MCVVYLMFGFGDGVVCFGEYEFVVVDYQVFVVGYVIVI